MLHKRFIHMIEAFFRYGASKLRAFPDSLSNHCFHTLLTRGMHSALAYVCDPDLQEYLRSYLEDES